MNEAELKLLDQRYETHDPAWWDTFYRDRTRPCTFFGSAPDESLVEWVQGGPIAVGRALDIGCGNGRNSVFLAQHGFSVEAIDSSRAAVEWAQSRCLDASVGEAVTVQQRNVFDLDLPKGAYALVYDSGCFHHIAPHRRSTYLKLVVDALRPGGWFGLVCFRPEGGSGYSDDEALESGTLGGGLGYTEARLREIWSGPFEIRVLRQMIEKPSDGALFGEAFLWVMLARKS